MSHQLRVLGEAVLETPPSSHLLTRGKSAALLIYAACHPGWVRRETYLALLWPETTERQARANLRQLLHGLRRWPQLGEFAATETGVRWDVATDVVAFREALKTDLPRAVSLYRGAFVAGFQGAESDTFDEWLESEREQLFLQYKHAVLMLVERFRQAGAFSRAAELLGELLQHDPFAEDVLSERLELLLRAGQVQEARSIYEAFRKRLKRELDETPGALLGEIAAQLTTTPQGVSSAVSEAVPLPETPVSEASPATWPAQDRRVVVRSVAAGGLEPPLLVGRTRERDALLRRLAEPSCRLLSLVGPGGIGKTRLALEVARAAAFRGGVTVALLEAVTDPEQLVPALAAALGLALEPGSPPEAQLAAHLGTSERLLILDNFEQLLVGKMLLLRLLEQAPGLKLLLTTRERLAVEREEVFELRGLSLPDSVANARPDASEAVALFVRCAYRAGVPLELEGRTQRAVYDICLLTGGMPLALELASQWLRLLSPEEIGAELEASLELLTQPSVSAAQEGRHENMRRVLAASWERLAPDEQQALAWLSVFRGGLTFTAAKAVAGMSVGVLLALVHKSLLYKDVSGRFTLHALVRQYAAEQLLARGDDAHAQHAHARYYLGLLGTLEMWSEREPDSLARLDLELDNVRVAWRWAVASGRLPALLPPNDVVIFFDRRMRFVEGLELLDAALPCYDPAVPEQRERLAALSTDRAWLLFRLSRYEDAETAAGLTLELTTDPKIRMKAHNTLGIVAQWGGRPEIAVTHIEAALELAQGLGETARVASYLNNLGSTYIALADYARAERATRSALQLHDAHEDAYGVVTSLLDLGNIALARGATRDALAAADEALALAHEHDFTDVRVVLLVTRAQILHRLNDLDEAKQVCRKVLELTHEPGHAENRVMTLNLLSRVATLQRDLAQARRYLTQGFLLAWRHKNLPGILENLVAAAELELCARNHARAHRLLIVVSQHPASGPRERRDAENLLALIGSRSDLPAEPPNLELEHWLPAFLGLEVPLD